MKLVVFFLSALAFCVAIRPVCAQDSESNNTFDAQCQPLLGSDEKDPGRVSLTRFYQAPELGEGLSIGRIITSRRDIFDESDPDENRYLYRLANRYHIDTRESVVREQLTFVSGEPYSPRRLEESERILRQNTYLSDARVIAYQRCQNTVDVLVITRDVWTLIPVIGFSTAGGDSSTTLGIDDGNILGSGKAVYLYFKKQDQRDGVIVGYEDNQVLGSRYQWNLLYADNSDGEIKRTSLIRPFYSLDSTWSQGVYFNQEEREDSYYFNGSKLDKFEHELDQARTFFGWSAGVKDDVAYRWLAGFNRDNHYFNDTDYSLNMNPVVPEDREFSYPWIGFERIEDRYSLYKNLRLLQRTEDVLLGRQDSVKLGYASKLVGSADSAWIFDWHHIDTLDVGEHHLLRHWFDIEAYWLDTENRYQNLTANYVVTYHNKEKITQSNYLSMVLTVGKNLTEDHQLTIGGNFDLRGYPAQIQDGNRRFLVSAERRYYFNAHWLNLFHFGAAIFVDVGQAWDTRDTPGIRNARTVLADAGFGLRINSSKARSERVIHVDLAFPLTARDHPKVDSYQWNIVVKNSF